MKNMYFPTLLLLVNLLLITACQNTSKTVSSEKLLAPITFQQQLQNKQGQLIDVRTPQEYSSGYIDQAKNIDFYADDFQTQLEQLNKTDVVYVYCKSGGRSRKTAQQMESMGFSEVYDLKGGITAWKKSQLKIVQP